MVMMCASLAVALPGSMSYRLGRSTSDVPTSAPVVWYQATQLATNTTCGLKVAEGILETNHCYTLYTAGMAIKQHESSNCVFKMREGVKDCSGDGSWTATAIPKGNASTCIYPEVLDGGNFQHKSGIYTCA